MPVSTSPYPPAPAAIVELHRRSPPPINTLPPNNFSGNSTNSTTSTTSTIIVNLSSYFVFRLSQCVITLLLNGSLLTFILIRRKLRRKNKVRFFLNLQIAHLALSGFGIWEVFVLTDVKMVVVYYGLLFEMFLSMVVVTGDRYVAIKYPYLYARVTRPRGILIISVSWILPVVFVAIAMNIPFNQYLYTMAMLTTVLIAFATMLLVGTNIRVYLIAQRHVAQIRETSVSLQNPLKCKNKNSGSLKSTYVPVSIVLSFFLLWLPWLVHNVLFFLDLYEPDSSKTFTRVIEHIALLNSLFDPILFVVFCREVKTELRKVVQCNSGSSSSPNTSRKSSIGNNYSVNHHVGNIQLEDMDM